MPTLCVIGSGGWGTALATVLSQKPDTTVRLWSARSERGTSLQQCRENRDQLPGIRIPDAVELTCDPSAAVQHADAWIVAVPTPYLRTVMARFRRFTSQRTLAVSLTKGIETDTFLRPTHILCEVLGVERLVALSGPSHAEEVARGLPTSLVAASTDLADAAWVQQHLSTERLRIYTNTDVVGVEIAGALKNVLGIAAGICDGLGFGDNAKAALLTRGLVEIQRFGVAFGADPATFAGLAGLGDLITTCFSTHGRNRRVGERLARGDSVAAVTSGPQVAEGVYTAKSVYERAIRAGLETPIMTGVYQVLYHNEPPLCVAYALLDRPQKNERPT